MIELRPVPARGGASRIFFIVRDDERIGSCELTLDESGAGLLDCWILPTHRGLGAATAAMRALLQLAVGQWGIKQLRANVPDREGPAARLFTRLGFHY